MNAVLHLNAIKCFLLAGHNLLLRSQKILYQLLTRKTIQNCLSHEVSIGVGVGEEFELGHGLVDEHGEAVDGFGAFVPSLLEQ